MFWKTSLLAGAILASADATSQSPVSRVVELIKQLKNTIEADGKMEQQVYDKFACWCADTTKRKNKDIDDANDTIAQLTTLIEENSGKKGTFEAEIAQLKKDIAANEASQADATNIRNKQNANYSQERLESEQTIGALEHATKVLDGAGTRKYSAMQEAETLSVLKSIEESLARLPAESKVTDEDKKVLSAFLAHPGKVSHTFLQNTNNPFGDYAPASTQIQGILKNMYETFVGQLERSNGEESKQNKLFKELMRTKGQEHATLLATLEDKQTAHALNGEELVQSKVDRTDAQKQLSTDKKFLQQTKTNCANNADAWSERSRMRTEEIAGIDKAIDILSSNEATFQSSSETFIQTSMVKKKEDAKKTPLNLNQAYDKISALAQKNKSIRLAALAVKVKAAGHFDSVIRMVDNMIATVRAEDEDDIQAKERCKAEYAALFSENGDLDHSKTKNENLIKRLENEHGELQKKLEKTDEEIKAVEKEMSDALEERQEQMKDFKKALQDDKDAAATIGKAIESLSAFYENNKLPQIGLTQQKPNYTVDPDKAPEGFTKGQSYKGRKSESTGVVAILGMLKEDVENEIKQSIASEAEAQKDFQETKDAALGNLKALKATKVNLGLAQAKNTQKQATADSDKNNLQNLTDSNGGSFGAHCTECAWIYSSSSPEKSELTQEGRCSTLAVSEKSSFDARKEKRKSELQGLQDARSSLAGATDDDAEAQVETS